MQENNKKIRTEKRREYDVMWYKRNIEKQREYSKKYYQENKERIKAKAEEDRIKSGLPKVRPGRPCKYEINNKYIEEN